MWNMQLHQVFITVKVKFAQSCPTLCDTMECTAHGILQARSLECVAFPFCRGSSQLRDQTQVSLRCRKILYQLNYKGSPRTLEWVACPFSRGSSWLRNHTRLSCIAGRVFINLSHQVNSSLHQLKPKYLLTEFFIWVH